MKVHIKGVVEERIFLHACTDFELHFHIGGLLSLLHQTQAERLEVDLVLGLLDNLSEQSSGGTQVVVFIGQ